MNSQQFVSATVTSADAMHDICDVYRHSGHKHTSRTNFTCPCNWQIKRVCTRAICYLISLFTRQCSKFLLAGVKPMVALHATLLTPCLKFCPMLLLHIIVGLVRCNEYTYSVKNLISNPNSFVKWVNLAHGGVRMESPCSSDFRPLLCIIVLHLHACCDYIWMHHAGRHVWSWPNDRLDWDV